MFFIHTVIAIKTHPTLGETINSTNRTENSRRFLLFDQVLSIKLSDTLATLVDSSIDNIKSSRGESKFLTERSDSTGDSYSGYRMRALRGTFPTVHCHGIPTEISDTDDSHGFSNQRPLPHFPRGDFEDPQEIFVSTLPHRILERVLCTVPDQYRERSESQSTT